MDTTIETQMKKLETIRKMKTADEILAKYEDEKEYHLHRADREFILQAMEEYANQFKQPETK